MGLAVSVSAPLISQAVRVWLPFSEGRGEGCTWGHRDVPRLTCQSDSQVEKGGEDESSSAERLGLMLNLHCSVVETL